MSTLKNLVDETTNIKNELKTCHTNLKTNLINKGVKVLGTDKIVDLISKIDEIKLGKKWASGEATVFKDTISIRGLDFKPRFIHGWQTGNDSSYKRNVTYCSSPKIDLCTEYSNYRQNSNRTVIYDDGFDLWLGNAIGGTTIAWQAYE